MFEIDEDKRKLMEKKIDRLEEKMDKKMDKIESNFKTFKETVFRLQEDKKRLKMENELLTKKYQKLLKKMNAPKLAKEVEEKLVRPAKKEMEEDAELIKRALEPGGEEKYKKKMKAEEYIKKLKEEKKNNVSKELSSLVSDKEKISVRDAALELNVSEDKIKEWGNVLEKRGALTVRNPIFGGAVLEWSR